jgi:hypothetical protein
MGLLSVVLRSGDDFKRCSMAEPAGMRGTAAPGQNGNGSSEVPTGTTIDDEPHLNRPERGRAQPHSSGRSLRTVTVGGLLLLAATAGALLWSFWRGSNPAIPDVNPRIRPAEFLYLDNARVVAFLSQLEDGLSAAERQTISRSSSVNVGLTGTVTGGASGEGTDSVERVVTPTGASRFDRLRNSLQDRGWLQSLDARTLLPLPTRGHFFRRLERAKEGGFVEITNVHLTVPPAVTVYRFARRSGVPDADVFIRMVGSDPRIPLSLRAERSPALLFVGRYASLADEPSLFFGGVTVFGKVIRLVPQGAVYRDNETLATYGPALAAAPATILRKLKIRPANLAPDLKNDVTVTAPGAVIIPIGIYK